MEEDFVWQMFYAGGLFVVRLGISGHICGRRFIAGCLRRDDELVVDQGHGSNFVR